MPYVVMSAIIPAMWDAIHFQYSRPLLPIVRTSVFLRPTNKQSPPVWRAQGSHSRAGELRTEALMEL
ncbi:MAG: hypothetical protein B6D36_06390 [Planctomycetes bacterium UTPLA1]|nr:MAG: hypothetical protein B6D36_06390 [Planctomycetes bacterium UTPLA1]